MGEVLGVPALVKERREVLAPADLGDHQVDLPGNPHRGAVGPRRLGRPLLGVEDDVRLLLAGRGPSPAIVSPNEGSSRSSEKLASSAGARKKRARSARRRLGPAEPEDRLKLGLEQLRVDLLGRLEEGARLAGQRLEVDPAELGVGGRVARPAELGDELVRPLQHGSVQRVDLLLEQLHAGRLDRPPAPGVGLVRLLDRRHPVGDLGAVDVDHQLRLAGGDRGLLRRAGPPQVGADGELEQVPGAAARARRSPPRAPRAARRSPRG